MTYSPLGQRINMGGLVSSLAGLIEKQLNTEYNY